MHELSMAWRNLRARKKQTVRMVTLVSVAVCLLIATTLVEKGVAAFIDYVMTDVPDTRILQCEGLVEGAGEELCRYYMDDERVLDMVLGSTLKLVGTIEKQEELAGEKLRADLGIYAYHEGIAQYTDYTGELQAGEVLIPRYFNPDVLQGPENMVAYKMRFLDAEEWIGKEITTKVNRLTVDEEGNLESTEETEEFTLKIVGTYDNVQMCDYQDNVYVSADTLEQMYASTMDDAAKNSQWAKTESVMMIVKNQEDVQTIAEESGLDPLVSGRDENPYYLFFMNGLKAVSAILFVAALINIVLTLTEEIRERKSEIALLRAMGYENGKIGRMLLWELIAVIAIVLAVVMVFSVLFVNIGNWFIGKFIGTIYEMVRISFDGSYLLRVVSVSVFAMLGTYVVVYYRLKSVNTVEALKSGE